MLRRFGVSALALVVSLVVMFALFSPHRSSSPPTAAEISSMASTAGILATTLPAAPAIAIGNPFNLSAAILSEPGLRAAVVFADRSRESFVSSVVAGRTSIYCDGSLPCRSQTIDPKSIALDRRMKDART